MSGSLLGSGPSPTCTLLPLRSPASSHTIGSREGEVNYVSASRINSAVCIDGFQICGHGVRSDVWGSKPRLHAANMDSTHLSC
jgi:hypothetical protein